MLLSFAVATTLAVSARWAYEDAYDNVERGAWYIGQNNESATLAWGESYVMASLAAMYRATNHPMYLDRLAEHIDAVLAQRDDARGVVDYRGISGACWRNMSYQPEPYCYAVHTGMLVTPMLEFVLAVEGSPWAEQPSWDGETLADKAARYLVAAQESAAFHDVEWNDGGYYVFPADLPSLPIPGGAQPLNQSNALGRVHVLLAALTGDAGHLAKATALAERFDAVITTGSDGAYLWNYYAEPFSSYGEDISHAAINVEFAVLAAEHGIVFDQADVEGFARTFTERVYVNDATFSDRVAGGPTNGGSYRAQIGRWVLLAPASPTVSTAVRDAYDRDYPASGVGSGSLLLAWALLAEHETKKCAPWFYSADWDDQGDVREATAYGANILTTPYDLATSCRVPVEHDAPRATDVGQWDGDAYHRVASWTASGGTVVKHVPYDPAWPFVYADDGVLFQFEDDFVAGNGIVVHEPGVLVPPTIDSPAPTDAPLGQPFDYAPIASGDEPRWWSLVDGPALARIDPATGVITWTADEPGTYAFHVRLDNEVGFAEQIFEVDAAGEGTTDGPGPQGDSSGAADDAGTTDGSVTDATAGTGSDDGLGGIDPGARGDDGGCSCRAPAQPRGMLVPLLFLWAVWRRQALRGRALSRAARAASLTET